MVGRIGLDCAVERPEGVPGPAQAEQRVSPPAIRERVPLAEPDRAAERRLRLGGPAQAGQHNPPAVAGLGVVRIEPGGPAVHGKGVLEPALAGQRVAARAAADGVAGGIPVRLPGGIDRGAVADALRVLYGIPQPPDQLFKRVRFRRPFPALRAAARRGAAPRLPRPGHAGAQSGSPFMRGARRRRRPGPAPPRSRGSGAESTARPAPPRRGGAGSGESWPEGPLRPRWRCPAAATRRPPRATRRGGPGSAGPGP